MKLDHPLDIMLKVAWANYGKPYIWGGDDPIKGFDCSGFVIECLKSVGILPHKGDWTAEMLRVKYAKKGPYRSVPTKVGDLVFYMGPNGARHVELCIHPGYTIGASGGGSLTTEAEMAAKQNAFIKIRPFIYRSERVECYSCWSIL